jgi:peptidoglycan hydrolase-like protein with peptidoglycan-binding domain
MALIIRDGIDSSTNTTPYLPKLKAAGVRVASRYMSIGNYSKNIQKPEADAIRAAGIQLLHNYEGAGATISTFSASTGAAHALHSRKTMAALGAPPGSICAMSCEPDPKNGAFNINTDYAARILPYYRAARKVLSDTTLAGPTYRLGAYTFGTWLDWLLRDVNLDFCWLPGAPGWSGYKPFLNSNRWHFRQISFAEGGMEQNFHGMQVDYDMVNPLITDLATWKLDLSSIPPVTPPDHPTIKRGATGPAVQELQRFLGVSPDGAFGPVTEKAVKGFQAANGLEADGIVGPVTWGALLAQRQGV